MTCPALPSFPVSTSTSFDDLMAIKAWDHFVIRGYEYRAEEDAEAFQRNGVELVSIRAKRRHYEMPNYWELADVLENRSPVAPPCTNR